MNRLALITSLMFFSTFLFSQNIVRKAYLGVATAELTDSIVKINDYQGKEGVVVVKVADNELTKKLKIKEGDIIISANEKPLKGAYDLYYLINDMRAGNEIVIELFTAGKKKTVKGKLIALPYEENENCEIIYDEVKFDEGWIRVITNKPKKEGKLPAILFIQGYTCSSMDRLGVHPYGQLINGLSDKGYVVMRVEKPGMGDNLNTQECDEIDLVTEIKAFEKGLEKLKTYDFVDTDNIFIWGHSMGGIIAPIITAKEDLKGAIVYGTGIKPWREYLVEMFRVQNPLFGVDYVDNEKNMIHFYNIIHQLFINKKTPKDIANDPLLEELMKDWMMYDGTDKIFSRSYKYLVQIDDFNLPECWKKTDEYVLSMWGTCDVEAYSDYDQKEIVDVVNHYHPGHATFLQIENTTHAFAKVENMKHGIENRNYKYMIENFNPEVVNETDKWIRSVITK